jgi:hypothetical protein
MKTSGIAGNIRCWNWLSTPAPCPAEAVTGSHFSVTPNTTMTTIPVTYSGRLARESPVTEMTRSTPRPAYSAAITPPMMPSGTTITNASRASLIELIKAARMNGSTADR